MKDKKSHVVAAIHQPNFLPWPGFFYKWRRSDVLVLLDDVQFIKRSIINRVKIKSPAGVRWLTIPVVQKGRYDQAIADVEIQVDVDWRKKILGSLEACYGRAPFFKAYYPHLAGLVEREYRFLADLNITLMDWLARELGVTVPVKRASLLEGVTGASTLRLVSICRALGADRYLSGFGGQKYQDEALFRQAGIGLEVYDFTPPEYPQLWGDFVPGLSTLDLLMNCGPDSGKLLGIS